MMRSTVTFFFNNEFRTIDFTAKEQHSPTTTVLNYLRSLPDHKGTKEGCAEGDCGACTVVLGEINNGKIVYHAVNSCLVFLPKLHKKWLITVEDLKGPDGKLHPVQQAMVDYHGSQCGYCTPGFVMSLFGLYKSNEPNTREMIDDALTGNLCRCTGYQPILEAADHVLGKRQKDQFSAMETYIVEKIQAITDESIQIETDLQKYFLPVSVEELLDLRKKFPSAILINGATDIALRVTKRHELLAEIIDTEQIHELKDIEEKNEAIFLGSSVNLNRLMDVSESVFPALHNMCKIFGSKQIRAMATIGGNLATASPIGDLLPVLMAYDASVIIKSQKGERSVRVDDFITGYRQTALEPDEIITQVKIPKPGPDWIIKSYKVSKRKDLDISTVSAAFALQLAGNNKVSKIKIIYGGMAEMTKHAPKTEQFFKGKEWSFNNVKQAMAILETEFTPISDARSGSGFRTLAAKNLLLKFWFEYSHENNQKAQKEEFC